MKKYKIKINHEEIINAESEEEALEIFWDSQNYSQHNVDNFLDEITEIIEIKNSKNKSKGVWLKMDIKLNDNKSKEFFISCCGKKIESCEDGVNGSDFFKCEECGSCYNVVYSTEED